MNVKWTFFALNNQAINPNINFPLSNCSEEVYKLVIALTFVCRAPLPTNEMEYWILIGEPSRKHPAIHCKK